MMRGMLTLVTLASVLFFPWPFSALLAVLSALPVPLLPLAAGIFFDTLYYVPALGLPVFTLWGGLFTLLAFFVRSHLNASIIRR